MKKRIACTVLLMVALSAGVSSHEEAGKFSPKKPWSNEPCAVDTEKQGAATEEVLKNKELLEFSPIYQVVSFI